MVTMKSGEDRRRLDLYILLLFYSIKIYFPYASPTFWLFSERMSKDMN